MQQQQPPHAGSSLYELLGTTQQASGEQLRQAFRRTALRLHPDKQAAAGSAAAAGAPGSRSGGAAAAAAAAAAGGPPAAACSSGGHAGEYAAVQAAWEVLRDPGRRASYDAQQAQRAQRAAAAAAVAVSEVVPLWQLATQLLEEEGGQDAEDSGGESAHINGRDGPRPLYYVMYCRCGGSYRLPADEAEAAAAAASPGSMQQLVVPCNTCSLHLGVEVGSEQLG